MGGVKRKGRPQDIDLSAAEQRCTKRSRSGSQAPTPNTDTPPADAQGYLECPEPNCNKKYKNANGLKYHQSHAHSGSNSNASADDAKEDMDTEDVPLSVVKNSVRKEKEARKENNTSKKDNNKDNGQNADKTKSDKSDNAGKKSDKEESCNDNKEAGNKSDTKCDNSNTSKKKDTNANKSPLTQNNGKMTGSQSNLPKSSSSSNIASNVPVSSSQVSSNSVQAIPSQTCASSPTTSSPASVIQSVSQGEKNDLKLVDIKPKIAPDTRVTKANRPIIPAPVLSNVQVTHSNLSPVMSHTQMSPQLKPIQPKPTIMGEPQNINPVLADLNKDRKKMQKKKNKDGSTNGSSQGKPEQPTIKIERTGVIKTNPMPNNRQQSEQSKREGSGGKDASRQSLGDTQRSHNLAPHPQKGVDLSHSRGGQNSNLLKVGSPLQVNTPDNHKGAVNDDVQSPAYSDISDANESASPAAPSDTSPQKQKEDASSANKKEEKREPTPPQPTDSQMMQHYNMYSYYAQSPYRMNEMSPGQKSTGSNSGAPVQSNQQPQDASKNPQTNEKKNTDSQPKSEKKADEKDNNPQKPKGPMQPMSGPQPSNMSPQLHEYQMQMYQQMYMQSLPQHLQYQYMVNGMYPPMDSNYVRQMMEEQHRRSQSGDTSRAEGGQGPDKDSNRGPDAKGQPIMGTSVGKKDENNVQKSLISPGQQQIGERTENMKSEEKNSGMKEHSLKEKQNETHQILKENIDLKNEMDKSRHDYMIRKQDEERRRYMYHEQKMIEERKKMELARKSASRPENLSSKAPGTKPIIEHNQRNIPSGLRASVELQSANIRERDNSVKRDSNNTDSKIKEVRDAHIRDLSANKYSDSSKTVDEKSRTPVSEKHRSETPTRNPETPKQRPSGSSSKSGSPMTSSSSVPGSPSFSPYVNSYQYMQNPHYMGMDPAHPLYRSHNVNPALVSGYPGNAYIHPSQMGYRPSGDEEKEKLSAQKSGTPSSESDMKKSDSGHGPYYSNVHKIHELSEKGQSKSRNSSPGPVKNVDSSFDKHREYTNSPPTQRHVHTHHHTHVLQPGPGLPVQPGAPLQGPPGFSPVYDPYSGKYVPCGYYS